MARSNVIVDFDGTIADSLPVIIELFYAWSKTERFTNKQIEEMRDMTFRQVLRAIDVPLWRVPSLLITARKDFGKYVDQIAVFTGMTEVIATLHKQGHKLYVISSNSSQNIHKFLKLHGIDKYFDDVDGNMSIFGKSGAMKTIIKKHKAMDGQWFAIGDETRDIEAAKKAGIKSIAVSWGFNSTKILKEYKPDFLVTQPDQIIDIINS